MDGGNINIDLAGVPGIGNLNTDVSVCDALSFLGQSCQVKEGRGMFNVTQAIPELGESVRNMLLYIEYMVLLCCLYRLI